ncbi:Mitochondrial fission process protein 1, partial [Globisporangium splendens]
MHLLFLESTETKATVVGNRMTQQQCEADGERPPAVDIWRDSLVRYLGYSNELGESFRPIVPRLVAPSYAVAFAYVVGDTYDKASKADARTQAQHLSNGKRRAVIADAAVDTLLWQTMVRLYCIVVQVWRSLGLPSIECVWVMLLAGRIELRDRQTNREELASGSSLGAHGDWSRSHPTDHPPD